MHIIELQYKRHSSVVSSLVIRTDGNVALSNEENKETNDHARAKHIYAVCHLISGYTTMLDMVHFTND